MNKFSTKLISRIFHISKINGMMLFSNKFKYGMTLILFIACCSTNALDLFIQLILLQRLEAILYLKNFLHAEL